MTDRELLKDAAKAAGYSEPNWPPRYDWNPLTDDGDAFRLMVKLGLLVCVMLDARFTGIRLPGEHIGGKYDEVALHGTDPLAATRRAIVRAAAEIGKKMK